MPIPTPKSPPPTPAALLNNVPAMVGALLLLDSLFFIFVKTLHSVLPPIAASAFVMTIATVQIVAAAAWQKQFRWQTFRNHWWFFLAIGGLVAAATAASYTAIAYIDPGTASLLGQSSIIFGLLFGVLLLRDRFTPRQLVGAVLALVGVFTISFQPGDYFRIGALLVVLGALFYAFHAFLYKRFGSGLRMLEFFSWRLIWCSIFLWLITWQQGQLVLPNSWLGWGLVLLVGTVDVTLNRLLYYLALRRLTISMHTLILTLSPVVTIIWALLIFQTRPTLQELIGGATILVGIFLVTYARPTPQPAPAD